MKTQWSVGCVLAVSLLATTVTAGADSASAKTGDVKSAAQDLATRLSTSPPVSTWVDDASKESSYQGDVNRMAYLASQLAAELANGSGRDRTLALYQELRTVGKRILDRSRATGEQLPAGDVAAYEQLMGKLEAYYGPIASDSAR